MTCTIFTQRIERNNLNQKTNRQKMEGIRWCKPAPRANARKRTARAVLTGMYY
ncbi:hypothetical protein KGP20_24440 (plasmid) [Enterobacter asburiae]|nr:hypothetical protein EEI76_22105 [Enterobacter cloacae]UAN18857.1 hypothetical protein KGP20_24440 [Enterobacter asburiae]UAN24830.1 hypothetical protein KGP25_25435 [Enterobacter sp. JBIWA003]UAN34233.1 hypothetical protein KGP22_23200 [Enterobacter sp. JBIWA005]